MKNNLVDSIKNRMDQEVRYLHNGVRGTCLVADCPNDAVALDMCNAHYIRHKKNRPINTPVQKKSDGKCIECGSEIKGKGGWNRCSKHFKAARQKAIKEVLVETLGGCCQKCKGVFPLSVYDFHHVGKKDADPSYLIANGSIDAIAKEINNCVLLCANCHRIEHEK